MGLVGETEPAKPARSGQAARPGALLLSSAVQDDRDPIILAFLLTERERKHRQEPSQIADNGTRDQSDFDDEYLEKEVY